MAIVNSILTYPIKSTQGIIHESVEITRMGLEYDRQWALFNQDNQCLTGREHPSLLDISSDITPNSVKIMLNGEEVLSLNRKPSSQEEEAVNIFSYAGYGTSLTEEANQWFSDYLKTPCRLLRSDLQGKRKVLSKHGGDPLLDTLKFADQAPVLLLSQASLAGLNDKLEEPINMDRFRPNIVVEDCAAHEEDSWSLIQIGDIQFKLIQPCVRCVFTTIDTTTKTKHPKVEPLRTLATYRKGTNKGVIFGMHAVPLSEGIIEKGASIKVLG